LFQLSCASFALPPHLHSFPTRRSSDLAPPVSFAQPRALRTAPKSSREQRTGARAASSFRRETSLSRRQLLKILSRRRGLRCAARDRKSTRLNSSHVAISYADFCLKK